MDINKLNLLKNKINCIEDDEIKALFKEFYGEVLEVNKIAVIDDLTKVYNRRILTNDLDYDLLVMCDVDNFKAINDKLGHAMGDKVLIDITQKFKKILGPNAIVCRYGGDEFTILFKNIDLISCLDAMNIIKDEINYDIDGVKVTISFGISQKKDNKNINEVIEEADKALYKSKQEGKNKITVFKEKLKKK